MSNHELQADYLIIGGGIIGLTIVREILTRRPSSSIVVIDKEKELGFHASGRNSGVLHAGFYYTADSLKAKFTRDGNRAMSKFCEENGLRINHNQKVVVARDESEVESIHELARRGEKNGVDVKVIDTKELAEIEPNAKTHEIALYSPLTATVAPGEVVDFLAQDLQNKGVRFFLGEGFKAKIGEQAVETTAGRVISAGQIINCAGLYADKIAREFGFSREYEILPFKGLYLKYTGSDQPVKVNIYPVPNLNNPFLGVHFTVNVDNTIKLGPTAVPVFWRENYTGWERFRVGEFLQITTREAELFLRDSFGFRKLALQEMKKYNRTHFINLARGLVHSMEFEKFNQWARPGIRAQLLHKPTRSLVQDFIVEGDQKSVHVLNAVSPAFTASFPMARWVVEKYMK